VTGIHKGILHSIDNYFVTFDFRQASEQYFTSSQFLAQDFRQVMGRPQALQGLLGRKLLLPGWFFLPKSSPLYWKLMNSIQGLVFDAYGTLLDVHSVAATAEEHFPGRGEEISRLWRDKQIEYTRLISLSDSNAAGSRHYQSFESITLASLEYVLKRLGLPLHLNSLEPLMQSYRRLRPFAEVKSVLASLAESQRPKLPMVVLSNGSREMLEAAIANAELMGFFDRLISADEVRQFKTSPQLYAMGPKALGHAAQQLLFVSSNGWDVMGAAWFGYQTCWINRVGLPTETIGLAPSRAGADLSCVLEMIQTQRRVS